MLCESIKEFFHPRTVTSPGKVSGLLLIVALTVAARYSDNHKKSRRYFVCNTNQPNKSFIEAECFDKYGQEYGDTFPPDAFVGFWLFLVAALLGYTVFTSRHVLVVEHHRNDLNQIPQNRRRKLEGSCSVFVLYMIQLVLRVASLVVFTYLQLTLRPMNFPATYECPLKSPVDCKDNFYKENRILNWVSFGLSATVFIASMIELLLLIPKCCLNRQRYSNLQFICFLLDVDKLEQQQEETAFGECQVEDSRGKNKSETESKVAEMSEETAFGECQVEDSRGKNESETESKVTEMSDINPKTALPSVDFKPGTVNQQDLMHLARDIRGHWRTVAFVLGLEKPELDQIDANKKDLYEKSHSMLRKWAQIYASSATYEKLGQALMNVVVGRKDLATQYCVKTERVNANKGSAPDKLLKLQDAVDFPDVATRPPVFISYQWDIQDTVKELKMRLEKAGFQCWMDINQMGGEDALNTEIDAALRASKVVIACVTEKYCRSKYCKREVTLADGQNKFIIPLLFEKVKWPPKGQLSLIFSEQIYINMTGGLDPDKFDELLKQLKQHLSK